MAPTHLYLKKSIELAALASANTVRTTLTFDL